MRTVVVAPLVLLLALAGCKTTSTSPSTPQPPASPSTASSVPAQSSTAGTSGSPSPAPGAPGARTAQSKDRSGATPTPAGERAGREASAESGTDARAPEGAEPQRGTPPDQVTLEDSEAAAGGESGATQAAAEGATSEQEVLDAALEAMQRGAQEPSLEEAAAGSTATTGDAAAGQPGGGARPPGGDTAASAGSAAAGAAADDIRAAAEGVTAGGSGDGELEKLNRELNDSLARFDGAMLGERERNQARVEETGGGRSGAGTEALEDEAAAGGAGEESAYGTPMPSRSGGAAEGTADDSSSGSGMSTAGGGSGRKGDFEHTASNSANVPADIPDGSDDDVVARQIREAAMKEKDPELREKLWEEYRKYTGSVKR